ncbi:MAG: bifunctional 5,10-methylenetetrahydrofolate dehydrogenase/5,10-methenyltetrahydrofolate cyclohydrolase [Candidatus Nealsonbacteria bacterium]|nr:bifunctional 5,10-methylenetetrahydrofolate dehydrogenase/5,10-methenyltetrahydrofolate cyclohydrolase [Candidatus Nealsonbacteria bacterium]
MVILNGREIAQEVLEDLAREIKSRDLNLNLGVVSVGQNSVSEKYQSQKKKAGEKIGLGFKHFGFPEKINETELKDEIRKITADKAVSGLVVQLPLPKHLSTNDILNLIPPAKDPDCLTQANLGRFYQNNALILPPVVSGIQRIFNKYKIEIKGRTAVVVGRGRLVGLPASLWLAQEKATVVVVNELTKDVVGFTQKADIIVSGAGKPDLIKGSMIKKGAVVIDCGTSVENNRVVGDVETQSVIKKAGFLAPVPGGVGPLTIACLLENLLKLSRRSG